jgi:subtilisin family serine protease
VRLQAARGQYELRRFQDLPLLAGHVDLRSLRALVADPQLKSVGLDPVVSVQLTQSVPLVNLDWMRAGGFDGSGATVAVVDTGVDAVHPDLVASIVDEYCYCDDGAAGPFGCCPSGMDEEGGAGSARDDHGHGTRVISVVSSDGVHADLGGAPQADVVAVRALDSTGNGYLSDIVSAINWVRTNYPGIEVLNLSLGFGLYAGDCDDVVDGNVDFVKPAIDAIRQAGTLVVAGSGNNRSGTHMIAPACLSDVISVGAVWDADLGSRTYFGCTDATTAPDQVTCWSNGNASTDIVAPGALMTVSQRSGTISNVAGTSYATPMVSACAALLAHEAPSASLAQLEVALATTPVSVVDAKNGLTYPRLDCVAAYHALPEPGAVASLASGIVLLGLLCRRRGRRQSAPRERLRVSRGRPGAR